MTGIIVRPFERRFAAEFHRLNLDWIERLFRLEASDLKVLDDPERSIIAPGGMIFFALEGDAVVGTAAMIRITGERYELARMAVATTHWPHPSDYARCDVYMELPIGSAGA